MGKNPTTLSKTLRRLMDAHLIHGKPISANELSKRTGVPQSTITRILNSDVKDPRQKQLQKLADFFGVSSSYLRGDEPAPKSRASEGATSYLIQFEPGEASFVDDWRKSPPEVRDIVAATLAAAMKAWRESKKS